MMRKIFHLSTCNTCQRIIKELSPGSEFEMQNIKEKNISAKELDALAKQVGSYEAMFSKRAMKYKSLGLKEKNLTEKDFRKYMLEEYTFLKRPFIIIDEEVFIGNSKKTIAAAKEKI